MQAVRQCHLAQRHACLSVRSKCSHKTMCCNAPPLHSTHMCVSAHGARVHVHVRTHSFTLTLSTYLCGRQVCKMILKIDDVIKPSEYD